MKQWMHDKFPNVVSKPSAEPVIKTDYIGPILDGTAWDAIGFDTPGWWYVAGLFAGVALVSAFLEEILTVTHPAGAIDLIDLKGQRLSPVLYLRYSLSQANKLIS